MDVFWLATLLCYCCHWINAEVFSLWKIFWVGDIPQLWNICLLFAGFDPQRQSRVKTNRKGIWLDKHLQNVLSLWARTEKYFLCFEILFKLEAFSKYFHYALTQVYTGYCFKSSHDVRFSGFYFSHSISVEVSLLLLVLLVTMSKALQKYVFQTFWAWKRIMVELCS